MLKRARFLLPVIGAALRTLRLHGLRTDKFRPSAVVRIVSAGTMRACALLPLLHSCSWLVLRNPEGS